MKPVSLTVLVALLAVSGAAIVPHPADAGWASGGRGWPADEHKIMKTFLRPVSALTHLGELQ
jgi:hypothetical protein